MKMDKLYAGLIAFVAGVALSAGSAFAQTNGYMVGDTSNMKLVPYYETGDMKATIIGIQNMSPQENSTKDLNADVEDIQAVLDGGVANSNAAPLITGVSEGQSLCSDSAACGPGDPRDPTKKANTEAALAKAQKAAYTEHMFITVNVYDAMGMAMKEEETDKVLSSATLCLAENQFGVVVLQGAMATGAGSLKMQTLSVADGDIDEYGFVEIMAGTKKYDGCVSSSPDGLTPVVPDVADAGTTNKVAAWTIIQDVGMGFFGTEVSTATIKKKADDESTTADESKLTDCANDTDVFQTANCGLIPERHDNSRIASGENQGAPNATNGVTQRATVYARYDAGDESMVYVWLSENMDTENTLPKDERMLEVSVICEDGTMPAGADADGDNKPDPIKVAAPDMVTMIDPVGDELGQYTDMCEGVRGVLKIMMPGKSTAGMVFTHISQMMGHYRMNFPGYSMANDTACTSENLDPDNVNYLSICAD